MLPLGVREKLLSQLNESCTSPALICRRGPKTVDVRMSVQQSPDRSTQRACAVAVNDSHLAQMCKRCFVEKLIDRVDCFVGCLSDHV